MSRSNSTSRIPKNVQRKNIFFLVDGECEYDYLKSFKRHPNYKDTLKNVDIEPDLPKFKSVEDQYEKLKEKLRHYDKVIWVVDYDVITKQSREQQKGKESSEQKFKRYTTDLYKIAKNYKNTKMYVLINNPSMEYWYLLHYEATSRYYAKSNEAERALRKHIKSYTKLDERYRKQIFDNLYPNLSKAIEHAKRINIDEDQILARADLYRIFENNCELLTDIKPKK